MKNLLIGISLIGVLSACSDGTEAIEVSGNPTPNEYRPGEIITVNQKDKVQIPKSDRKFARINAIPPRFQWNSNSGYCGEVSMISAGLYYGQYLSQYDVRSYASPGKNQLGANQLLLGQNDAVAAEALNFTYERKRLSDNATFLTWVKHHVAKGHPVIIGLLNNENILYRNTNPTAGQPQYDHIVPVVGFYSDNDLNAPYNSGDRILFSDNGLFTPNDNYDTICYPPHTNPKNGNVPYLYAPELKGFCLDRKQANSPNGPVYSLLSLPDKPHHNYGIAITGIKGNKNLLPVYLTTDYNFEYPCIPHKSSTRPASMSIVLGIHVSGLTKGKKYAVYYYTSMKQVPVGNQKQKEKFRWNTFTAAGATQQLKMKIQSDQEAIFRVVEVKK